MREPMRREGGWYEVEMSRLHVVNLAGVGHIASTTAAPLCDIIIRLWSSHINLEPKENWIWNLRREVLWCGSTSPAPFDV
jgi:hypothetical protein